MKIFFTTIIALLTVVGFGIFTQDVTYDYNTFSDACSKLDNDQKKEAEACQTTPSQNPIFGPDGILLKVTNLVAIVAGVLAVIIIIIAGMQYVFSNGDSQKAASARSTIIYTIVGMLVVLVARSIIALVVSNL